MSIRFLVLGGGDLGFFWGGGKCRFFFYGREDFSEPQTCDSQFKTRTLLFPDLLRF